MFARWLAQTHGELVTALEIIAHNPNSASPATLPVVAVVPKADAAAIAEALDSHVYSCTGS